MPDFDYGTAEQAQQVFPGYARTLKSMWTDSGDRLLDLNAAYKRKKIR